MIQITLSVNGEDVIFRKLFNNTFLVQKANGIHGHFLAEIEDGISSSSSKDVANDLVSNLGLYKLAVDKFKKLMVFL